MNRAKKSFLLILVLLVSVLLNAFLAFNLVDIAKENADLRSVVQEFEQNEQAEFSFITKGSRE